MSQKDLITFWLDNLIVKDLSKRKRTHVVGICKGCSEPKEIHVKGLCRRCYDRGKPKIVSIEEVRKM
jgi:hypothetical protein